LGETTDTLDATGAVLDRHSWEHLTPSFIRDAVEGFRGEIQQLPPMYSAVKVEGVPLYRSARAGKTIAREPRTVVIHQLEILGIDGRDVTLRVVCSKGTYIRTLCADIGKALGVGGHLRELERTRVGSLMLDQALTVDDVIRRHSLGGLTAHIRSLDEVLGNLPALAVDSRAAVGVCHGAPVAWSNVLSSTDKQMQQHAGTPVRIHDGSGRLLAVGRLPQPSADRIAIEKVFATDLV
jgi:tRNA pseudouridine55 synthase